MVSRRWFTLAVACTALGAVLLAGGVWLVQTLHAQGVEPKALNTADLTAVSGMAGDLDGEFVFAGLDRSGRAAAITRDLELEAARYGLVTARVVGAFEAESLRLIWRTADQEQDTGFFTHSLPLESGRSGPEVMAGVEGWRGTVVALGILMSGRPNARLRPPATLSGIELRPQTGAERLQTFWRQWTAFEGWGGYSINFIRGGQRNPAVAMVPAVAAVAGLAVLLYVAWAAVSRRRWDGRVVLGAFLLGWLALDARWQWDLARQHQQTYAQFAGKTWQEKRLAARDGPLFRFAQRAKSVLPEPPQRIFLHIADPDGRNEYLRLRTRYHLLPHNVLAHGGYLYNPYRYQPGDYIAVVGRIPGVVFDVANQRLQWKGFQMPVKRVLRDRAGVVYRVTERKDEADG